LIVQIYVDDTIIDSTNAALCKEFSKTMQAEYDGRIKVYTTIFIKTLKSHILIVQIYVDVYDGRIKVLSYILVAYKGKIKKCWPALDRHGFDTNL